MEPQTHTAATVHLAHEVGEVGAKRRVRVFQKTPTPVASLRNRPNFAGEVYDRGQPLRRVLQCASLVSTLSMRNP
jgi:hypothetical protein